MNEREIERWTREVAEDPGAPSFVRLARAYRSQGRRDAAREVVLRGLERSPEHLAAHGLLALIHVEDGDRERAGDEWEIVLRLDPANFDAGRGLGFLALERGDLDAARRHLETAARARPDDPAVAQALEVLARREAERGSGLGEPAAGPGAAEREPPSGAAVRDPAALFDVLSKEGPFFGAVVLDGRGLVLAGGLEREGARGDLLGALISSAVEEARRTARMVGLGAWDGLLLDCEGATLHVADLGSDAVIIMAMETNAPAGWAVRTAERAQALARSFLEAQS